MRFVLLVTLAACTATPDAEDCLPTWGNQCDGCVPKCMTQDEIDDLGDICDIDCGVPTDSVSWTCEVVDGECAVVDP